jgi:spore maturation protein CgeB
MKIAFYGSSLLSSWWNGAATYYRGLLRDLSARGYDITFYEPDAYERQSHRDMDPPDWARSVVYPATAEGLASVLAEARAADIVVKASGVDVPEDSQRVVPLRCRVDRGHRGAQPERRAANLLGRRRRGDA